MMMHALPSVQTIEGFRAWRTDASRCLSAALDIARSHGLPHADPHLFSTGTNLVVALDDALILKIFPPFLRSQFVSERLSLSLLRGRLGVPIPEIVFEGERDQWPYLVITRLPGILGTQAWPTLAEDQKQRVLLQIGETMAGRLTLYDGLGATFRTVRVKPDPECALCGPKATICDLTAHISAENAACATASA